MEMLYSPVEVYGNYVFHSCVLGHGHCHYYTERDDHILRLVYDLRDVQDDEDAVEPEPNRCERKLAERVIVKGIFDTVRNEMVDIEIEGADAAILGLYVVTLALICIIPETSSQEGGMRWAKKMLHNPRFIESPTRYVSFIDMPDEFLENADSRVHDFRSLASMLGIWQPCPFECLV